jgi:hypothetical protein
LLALNKLADRQVAYIDRQLADRNLTKAESHMTAFPRVSLIAFFGFVHCATWIAQTHAQDGPARLAPKG